MKTLLVAGNWKMHKTTSQALELVGNFCNFLASSEINTNVLVCPPFTALYPVSKFIQEKNCTKLRLGAQNCYFESEGAYTGEISPEMLKDVGCEYVIVGHSERRTYFKESDDVINKKLHKVLELGMKPIFCIGESLQERMKGLTFNVLERQLILGLENIPSSNIQNIVIAYEPVWAIGTGQVAKVEQIDEAHNFIATLLHNRFGDASNNILILYGGSINSNNCFEIFRIPNVYGGLVGGASLKANEFIEIIRFAEKVSNEYAGQNS